MHPILVRGRLPIYLAAWGPIAGLWVALSAAAGRGWREALGLALPLAVLYAFACLGSWWLCRALPLDWAHSLRITAAHALAGATTSAAWLAVGRLWSRVLAATLGDPAVVSRYLGDLPLLFAVGALLFVLVSSVHYLLISFETSRAAERRALEMEVHAREARLRALTAQVNPHFLFNSLNSVSALTGSDPAAARRMCLLLADFLRSTLRLGGQEEISLDDELALADAFLGVERVRFGTRLAVERNVSEDSRECRVPPLILQPLVENAIVHGIAGLVDGGTLRITAQRIADRVEIAVENPRDPGGRRTPGPGFGLSTLRERLAARFGSEARLEVREAPDAFAVTLRLPARSGHGP